MANKQTKAYRKLGLSTHNGGAEIGGITKFDLFEGRPCITDFASKDKNPQNKRKSAWKGCKNNKTVAKLTNPN
jgi:hypothetical protein